MDLCTLLTPQIIRFKKFTKLSLPIVCITCKELEDATF